MKTIHMIKKLRKDITNFKKLSIKTWSPKVGATVRFKIENDR